RESTEVLVGDRGQDEMLVVDQTQAQRLTRELEARVAGAESPRAIALGDVATLDAADDQAIVGPGIGAGAEAENAGSETCDLENVHGTGPERRTGCRRAEAVGRDASDGVSAGELPGRGVDDGRAFA